MRTRTMVSVHVVALLLGAAFHMATAAMDLWDLTRKGAALRKGRER